MEETISRRRQAGINGNALKLIAVISMLLDHTGLALLYNGVLYAETQMEFDALLGTPQGANWYFVYRIMRFAGRLAFPIFCFLIVEGFLHTKDRKKYAFRLFLFALISEIPFDLVVSGTIWSPEQQNVYFTLLTGLAVLTGYEYFDGRYWLQMAVTAAGFFGAFILRSDYDAVGVAMILVLYLFRNDKKKQLLTGAALGFLESFGPVGLGGAALAFIPLGKYNGQRGRRNLKYFFYWFYPVHLLLLFLVSGLLFGFA